MPTSPRTTSRATCTPRTHSPSRVNHSPTDDGWTDILLVGSDARTDAQGNPLPARLLKALRTEDKAGVNTDTINVLRIRKKRR
jgi:anionic cell wall polymer biosynthesis LytR-Cps2A-Psr (LCP) family protein